MGLILEERFDDEGYSGTTLDRPALQRLLSVIRSGGIEQLVIHRLDRLSRNLRHFITLFEELRDHNVTLEIVTAQGLGEAALDKFMLSILASFAELERISRPPESPKRPLISKRMEDGSPEPSHSDMRPIVTRSS